MYHWYIGKVPKKLVESNSTTEQKRTSLKAVGSRPGVVYGLYKVYKVSAENCPSF